MPIFVFAGSDVSVLVQHFLRGQGRLQCSDRAGQSERQVFAGRGSHAVHDAHPPQTGAGQGQQRQVTQKLQSQLQGKPFKIYLLHVFSAPEPKAQVHYCDHALSVVRPSVCLSVVRRQLFTFSTSPLKPLNRIQRNLTGSKNSTSSTKFVFFGPIGKTRWPPWPLIGWDIFNFSSETA